MPIFAPTTALQMSPSGAQVAPGNHRAGVCPFRTRSPASGAGQWSSGPGCPEGSYPCLFQVPLQSKDSVPKAGSPVEDSSSRTVHPGATSEGQDPSTSSGKTGLSWPAVPEGLAPPGMVWPPGVAAWSAPGRDAPSRRSFCQGRRPRLQPDPAKGPGSQHPPGQHPAGQAAPQPASGRALGTSSHVVRIEVGTLSAFHPQPSQGGGGQSPSPGGTREDGDGGATPMGKKRRPKEQSWRKWIWRDDHPPPLHRFPSWVRSSLRDRTEGPG